MVAWSSKIIVKEIRKIRETKRGKRINGCSINGHKVCLHMILMKAWGIVCPPKLQREVAYRTQ